MGRQAARACGSEARIGQLNPLQRYGRPDEIAAMALKTHKGHVEAADVKRIAEELLKR